MLSTFLFVFDFDHTVLDCNSDTIIYNVLPSKTIPEDIANQYNNDWNRFMQIVFDYLHSQNITQQQIKQIMIDAPLTKGFLDIFKILKNNHTHSIIASDSNTYFINTILQDKSIVDVFQGVFTNPAHFQNNNHLIIQPYQIGHGCTKCRPHMCKTKIIQDFIKKQSDKGIKYEKVVFLGDGGNDFCPIKQQVVDIAFVRLGFALQKLVKQQPLKCSIHYWNDGDDVVSVLKQWK